MGRYGAYAYGPADGNKLYLSFNAGYEYNNNSNKILDILARQGVRAVFFVDGYFVRANAAVSRRMVNEGHLIGNHTALHGDLIPLLNSSDHTAALEQIRGFETIHLNITGKPGPKLFRPPSSEWSERQLAFVRNLGYTTYLFSWTHRDWLTNDQPPAADTLAKLKTQVYPGSTIMLHSVGNTNVAVLEEFIIYAKNQGYTFALLPQR